MSNVPTWKRNLSKVEFLYQTYQLTIEVGKMAGKVSKKSYRKYERNFYVLTYDLHDYFNSIEHDVVMELPISEDTKWIMQGYLDLFPERGVGIGGEPSQDVAVAVPSKIDRMIACEPYVIDSGRYMDDGYAIVETREEAEMLAEKVEAMAGKLKLTLNKKRSHIYWMERDTVVWLKKRTGLTETGKIKMRLVRKNIVDESRRIRHMKVMVDNGEMPKEATERSIECWVAYAKPYNSRQAVKKIVVQYAWAFDVSMSRARILLRRRTKGWITNEKSSS